MSKPEFGFQETVFLLIDRLERTVEQLKDELRTADEFLLSAQAHVDSLIQKQGPGIPHVILRNDMPQSIGFQAGWQDGKFMVLVAHRGEEGVNLLPPGQQAEVEV